MRTSRGQMQIPCCHRMQRGAGDLDEEAAADVAAYVTAVRGPGAPGTAAEECRSLSPAFLADVWQARVVLAILCGPWEP